MNNYSDIAPAVLLAPSIASPSENQRVSLCEVLDRILNKGVVLAGDVVISVADVDLIYLNVRVLLASVETAYRQRPATAPSLTISP